MSCYIGSGEVGTTGNHSIKALLHIYYHLIRYKGYFKIHIIIHFDVEFNKNLKFRDQSH